MKETQSSRLLRFSEMKTINGTTTQQNGTITHNNAREINNDNSSKLVSINDLRSMSTNQRTQLLSKHIAQFVAETIDTSINSIEYDVSTVQYGLDSLMVRTLASKIKQAFSVSIPVVFFLQGASVNEITTKVWEELQKLEQPKSQNQKPLFNIEQHSPQKKNFETNGSLNLINDKMKKTTMEENQVRKKQKQKQQQQQSSSMLDDIKDFDRLSKILQSLCSINGTSQTTSLPKFRYPSAGGLYPIQTYLQLSRSLKNSKDGSIICDSGFYYLQPIDQTLRFLSKDHNGSLSEQVSSSKKDSKLATLIFVLQTSAMEPLYGTLTDEFSWLEMGYISQMLDGIATENGMHLEYTYLDSESFNDDKFSIQLTKTLSLQPIHRLMALVTIHRENFKR
jgi:acyl carrier protein